MYDRRMRGMAIGEKVILRVVGPVVAAVERVVGPVYTLLSNLGV